MSAKLFIITGAPDAERIAKFADEHADFDRTNRQVVRPGDNGYPTDETIARWARDAVAVVSNTDGTLLIFLSKQRATSEVWIEDALLRAAAPEQR